MAITLIEYNRRLNGVISDLKHGSHGKVMIQIATEALTLVKKRIQERGENAEGSKFKPYSTTPMLASHKGMTGSAYSKVAGSKQKRKELKWVTIGGHKLFELEGGYKEFRQLHGRQTEFVDFTFSGRMWNNIKLKSSSEDHNSGIAIIGATQEEEEKKLEGNTKRKGEIMALSNKEIKILTHSYEQGILNIWRKNKLL